MAKEDCVAEVTTSIASRLKGANRKGGWNTWEYDMKYTESTRRGGQQEGIQVGAFETAEMEKNWGNCK